MANQLPTPELLRKLLRCEPEAGLLFWRVRDASMCKNSGSGGALGSAARWNGRHAGKEAFICAMPIGYKCGSIFDYTLYAHRVIWAMVHGKWPDGEIDHINHIRTDNRIENLRDVTRGENNKNMSALSGNTSGHVGVRLHENGKWRAQITINNRSKHIGYYFSKADAVAARLLASEQNGFHENHGK